MHAYSVLGQLPSLIGLGYKSICVLGQSSCSGHSHAGSAPSWHLLQSLGNQHGLLPSMKFQVSLSSPQL
jgi:hypothetical protein